MGLKKALTFIRLHRLHLRAAALRTPAGTECSRASRTMCKIIRVLATSLGSQLPLRPAPHKSHRRPHPSEGGALRLVLDQVWRHRLGGGARNGGQCHQGKGRARAATPTVPKAPPRSVRQPCRQLLWRQFLIHEIDVDALALPDELGSVVDDLPHHHDRAHEGWHPPPVVGSALCNGDVDLDGPWPPYASSGRTTAPSCGPLEAPDRCGALGWYLLR